MTDNLDQAFNSVEFDSDEWLQFQLIDLKEMEFPNTIGDVISIWYKNSLLGECLYFSPTDYTVDIIKLITKYKLEYETEELENGNKLLIF